MEKSPADEPAILGGEAVCSSRELTWPPDDPAIRSVIHQLEQNGGWGQYHGPHCEKLRKSLGEYHAAEHVQLCSSGTVAMELALRGLKIQAGDEVILSAYDFKSNISNVLLLNAVPVLVDAHPDNGNLDPCDIEHALSSHTKAIIVSHLHGGVVPISQVRNIADSNRIALIEDACQMTGALIEDRRAGMWGDVGILSFGGSKLLTCGRGGAVLTNSASIAQRIKLYTQRGNDAYPLSEFGAAVLLPQLERLDERNRTRLQFVNELAEHLSEDNAKRKGTDSVLRMLKNSVPSAPSYYKLGFLYDGLNGLGMPRELFSKAMRAEGIPLDAGFRSFHRILSSRRFRTKSALDIASRIDEEMMTLHHPILLTGKRGISQFFEACEKICYHASRIIDAENKTEF